MIKKTVKYSTFAVLIGAIGFLLTQSFTVAVAATQEINDSIGRIEVPPGVENQIAAAEATGAIAPGEIAIFYFVSVLLKIGIAIAGIWVMVNVVLAGYIYITGKGEQKAAQLVRDKLTMSVVGLVIIVGSYTIIAVLSLLLFGDAGFILNPTLEGPY